MFALVWLFRSNVNYKSNIQKIIPNAQNNLFLSLANQTLDFVVGCESRHVLTSVEMLWLLTDVHQCSFISNLIISNQFSTIFCGYSKKKFMPAWSVQKFTSYPTSCFISCTAAWWIKWFSSSSVYSQRIRNKSWPNWYLSPYRFIQILRTRRDAEPGTSKFKIA